MDINGHLGPVGDPLVEAFEQLEREVQQRDCPHEVREDLSTFLDGRLIRSSICTRCGAILEERSTRVDNIYCGEP